MGVSVPFRPVLSSRSLDVVLLWEKFPREMFYSKPNVLVSQLNAERLERYEAQIVLAGLGMFKEGEINGPSQKQQKETVKHKRKRLCEVIKSATETRMAKAKGPETIPAPANTFGNTKMLTAFANVPVLAPAPRSAAPPFTLALPTPAPSSPSVTGQSSLARLSEGLDNARFETYLNNIQTLGKSDEHQSHQAWTRMTNSAERDIQRRKREHEVDRKEHKEIEVVADGPSKKDTLTDTLEMRVDGHEVLERDDVVASSTVASAVPIRAATWPSMNSSKDSPEAKIWMETFAAYIPPHKRPGYQCEPASSPPKAVSGRRRGRRGGRKRKESKDSTI